jgi:transposase
MAWLRARVAELEELNARLREAAAARDALAAAQLAARDAQIAALAAQVEELRRRADKDSSTSSKPPSSDSPYRKKPRDRSLRGRSGRRPGKQPGAQSSTLKQSPHPDDTVLCGPAACGCCGHDLTGEPVLGTVQKRQVFEASPPPPPTVTEYQVTAKQCPECGEVSVGLAPAGVTGRVQYGPLAHAKAALAVLRALPAGHPRRPAGRRADRRERLCRVRGRHPGQGRPAAGAVHGPGPGAAARRPGAVRRRDPRPGR